jgi:hypothetical protein
MRADGPALFRGWVRHPVPIPLDPVPSCDRRDPRHAMAASSMNFTSPGITDKPSAEGLLQSATPRPLGCPAACIAARQPNTIAGPSVVPGPG